MQDPYNQFGYVPVGPGKPCLFISVSFPRRTALLTHGQRLARTTLYHLPFHPWWKCLYGAQ